MPADGVATSAERPDAGDHGDRDRARDERLARLRDGLTELDRWLDDRIRTGLADPALARYATWDTLAARLVDARAGALANRVRRLAGAVGTRPDWHEHVLAELGVLHLLAQAGQRVAELPPELADAVATACGWQVRQADVLAGVPDTDTWVVAGRSDTREDRIEVRRIWLRGQSSGRWAMILSFAAYRQSLDSSLAVGTAIEADLHRYPGVGLRALVGTVHGASPPDVVCSPPAGTVADACDDDRPGHESPSRGPTICRPRCGRRSRGSGAGGSSATTPARSPSRPKRPGSRSCSPPRPARRSTSPSSGPPTASYRSPSTSTTASSTSARAPICPS